MEITSLSTQEAILSSRRIQTDIAYFAEAFLGLPVTRHFGQMTWLNNSNKTINILRPGNKWGKSLIGGVKHIWHAAVKPALPKDLTDDQWLEVKYDTLNFGPGYEQAREILKMVRDIIQGRVLIPNEFRDRLNIATGEPYGTTNVSYFKDWFITQDRADSNQLPYLGFATGASLLGRSYDEMGKAFKMKALAYCSGDECADINDLWTFTNGTLLPRMVTVSHPQIDYYGTPQPSGTDYMRMIEMAEEDMKRKDYAENGMWYVQKGSMYDNVFLPAETIREIERIADPQLREQIIRGEYVEAGEKYYGFERVNNAIDKTLKLYDVGLPGRKYIVGADFAGGESAWADYTVIMVVDYTEEPYRVVYFNRFKGGDVSIPNQYLMVQETVEKFNAKLIIDSSALGGRNAMAFLGHLQPIAAEFGPTKTSTKKAEMLASLKIALDGGNTERKRIREAEGDTWVDTNHDWGLIRFPDIPHLVSELMNYKLDDAKLRNDCVMAIAMIVHWLELRRPRQERKRAVGFDFLGF